MRLNFLMKKYKIKLPLDTVITYFVILMGLFFYSCENTITNNFNGCTDSNACNYDPDAKSNDDSCVYTQGSCDCNGNPSGNYCDCNENIDFECGESSDLGVVINEINYRSSPDFNPEDWVELYNSTDGAIDIGLWEFKDNNFYNVFTIPDNIELLSEQYLVLCKDTFTFSQLFPSVSNVIGDFEFGLNGDGELVRLFDSNGLLVDMVEYDDIEPWPIEPGGGTGKTLELINPLQDNALEEHWKASDDSSPNGTPGIINSVYDGNK